MKKFYSICCSDLEKYKYAATFEGNPKVSRRKSMKKFYSICCSNLGKYKSAATFEENPKVSHCSIGLPLILTLMLARDI